MWESYLLFEGNYKEGKRKLKTRTVIRRSRRTQLPLRESGAASFDAYMLSFQVFHILGRNSEFPIRDEVGIKKFKIRAYNMES